MIEEISAFVFYCTPWDKSYPIRSIEVIIYAKDREEADLLFNRHGYKFFEQNLNMSVRVIRQGYRNNEQGSSDKANEIS